MFAPLVEVAISLAFIYLLFSLVVSWINEFITSRLAARGKYLREQLSEALDDQHNKNWAELLYVHPAIDLLAKKEQRPPAYIPGNLFAIGLIDLITNEAKMVKYRQDEAKNVILEESLPYQEPINNFNAGLQKLKKSEVKILLQNLLDNAGGDYGKLKTNLITWYDDYMDRVSGWYKKKIRGWLFLIGLGVTIAFNVDTIHLVTALWKNASLRESVVKAADTYISRAEPLTQTGANASTKTPQPDSLRQTSTVSGPDSTQSTGNIGQLAERIDSVYQELKILNLPIGYECVCVTDSAGIKNAQQKNTTNTPLSSVTTSNGQPNQPKKRHLTIEADGYFATLGCAFKQWWADPSLSNMIGWIITAGALSFGAPFWFDILKKFVNVRSSGIKPEKVSTEDVKN